MFSLVSGMYQAYLAPTQLNILIVGGSGVGKTTILERCKVTQFSAKAKPQIHPNTSNKIEDVPNVPVHWLKPMADDSNNNNEKDNKRNNCSSNNNNNNPFSQKTKEEQTKGGNKMASSRSNNSSWLCPAPRKYAEAAIPEDGDEDEEYVDIPIQPPSQQQQQQQQQQQKQEDDANSEEEELHPAVRALGDIPSPAITRGGRKIIATPTNLPATTAITTKTTITSSNTAAAAAPTQLQHRPSNHNNNQNSTLGDISERSFENGDTLQSSSVPVDDNMTIKEMSSTSTSTTGTNTTPSSTSQQSQPQEYDLKPKCKMLALSKIRRTIGMNIGKVTAQGGVVCHFWDVGGRMRELWERYYNDADAVIFVWKTPYVGNHHDNGNSNTNNDDKDDDDSTDSRDLPVDYAQQLAMLESVRSSIPDDVPFLVLGHVFSSSSSSKQQEPSSSPPMATPKNAASSSITTAVVPQTDIQYSTARLLPHYHNPYQALFFANAATGQGVRTAMEWLIPIAKRQLKIRETRQEGGGGDGGDNPK